MKLIVDYVIANGIMEKKILNEQPFNKFGNVIHLFDGKVETARSIIRKIDEINGRLQKWFFNIMSALMVVVILTV